MPTRSSVSSTKRTDVADDHDIATPRGVAVVTGASGGLGRAVARELAERGYDIGLLARGRAGLAGAKADVTRVGRRAIAVPTDVADFDAVESAAAQVTEELGDIDVWVNNAMTTVFKAVTELDHRELHRSTEVTYYGQVHGTLAALSRMEPRDTGTIVSVGSALAYRGIPMQSAYCASKFAVRGFMESLRTELIAKSSGVRVSQVHMPAINTPQFGWSRTSTSNHPMPVPPIYRADVCARAVADAVEHAPRQKIVGSWNWFVVQLNKVMPGVGDHYMARTGVDSQLSEIPISPDRPDNLRRPVDEDRDHGADGIFGDRTGGVLQTDFVRSLPGIAAEFLAAISARALETASRRIRPKPMIQEGTR